MQKPIILAQKQKKTKKQIFRILWPAETYQNIVFFGFRAGFIRVGRCVLMCFGTRLMK